MNLSALNPLHIFYQDWQHAKQVNDANAEYCFLSTINQQGQVASRTLVLRDIKPNNISIFINQSSDKWLDIQQQPVELLVFWPSLMKQYRFRGQFVEIPKNEMQIYWQNKPYQAKLLDWYYSQYQAQSTPIDNKQLLEDAIEQLKQKWPQTDKIPYPENAKGLSLVVNYVEQWIWSEHDRLHDRHLFTLNNEQWLQQILVP